MKRLRFVLLLLLFSLCVGSFAACNSVGDIDYEKEGYTAVVKFDFQGGKMKTDVFEASGYITYRYKPGSLAVDPLTMDDYSLTLEGNRFLGWYVDEAGTREWDFKTPLKDRETVTLYAKWEKRIRYSYSVCYKDENGEIKELYNYAVNPGNKFNSEIALSNLRREGYTAHYDVSERYWKDAECTQKWDMDFEHPGGDTDHAERVFVKFIKGEWEYVKDFSSLRSAINADLNAYMLNDVDCNGSAFQIRDYSGILEGNGHTVSNITQTLDSPVARICLFEKLNDGAQIQNVTFANVKIFTEKNRNYSDFMVSAFALEAVGNVKINNVNVNGTFTMAEGVRLNSAALTAEDIESIKSGLTKPFVSGDNVTVEKFAAQIAYAESL